MVKTIKLKHVKIQPVVCSLPQTYQTLPPHPNQTSPRFCRVTSALMIFPDKFWLSSVLSLNRCSPRVSHCAWCECGLGCRRRGKKEKERKESQTVLGTRQQSPVGLLTIWLTILADLTLTFYKGCPKLLPSPWSLWRSRKKKESGKL